MVVGVFLLHHQSNTFFDYYTVCPKYCASKAPRSKLILVLRQHFCLWARAERVFSTPASPADSPSACPLPLAQTTFTADTTNTAVVVVVAAASASASASAAAAAAAAAAAPWA